MADTLDRLSEAAAAPLPRRRVLRTMAGVGFGAVLASVGRDGGGLAAQISSNAGGKGVPSVAFMIRLPGSDSTALVTLADRSLGRVHFKGQRIGMVPHISKTSGTVELSVYRGAPSSKTTLARRVTLPINGRRQFDAELTELGLDFLPGVAVAALAHNDVPLSSRAALGNNDCCVYCCLGGEFCYNAVCCDTRNPGCGSCCDSGWCPGCS